MPAQRSSFRFGILLVTLVLFSLTNPVFAQTTPPIQIGQNAIGELTASTPALSYSLTASSGETALVQVLALSPGFAPRFRLLNPAGVEILTAPNPTALSSLTGNASFPDAGSYTIEVAGENGTLGQFVLSLQPGAPPPQATELAVNQAATSSLSGTTPAAVYHFSTTPDEPLVLTLLTDAPDAGLLVSLFDETAGKTIASSDATLSGSAYRLPPRAGSYRLELHASSADETPYTLCLGTCESGSLFTRSALPAATPEVSAPTCTVVSATGGTVNIRSGAGTQFAIIANLATQPLPALGRLADSSWIQLRLPSGALGWVAASVTRLEGDCAALPIVAAPANAALAPTLPPPAPTTASGGGSAPMPTSAPTTEPPPAVTLPDISVTISFVSFDGVDKANIGYSIVVQDVTNPFFYRVQICLDNTCVSQDKIASESSSSGIIDTFTFMPDGRRITHRATITVDYTRDVVESNESNNVATYNFQ